MAKEFYKNQYCQNLIHFDINLMNLKKQPIIFHYNFP